MLFATNFGVCAVIDTETHARRDFLNEDANFCVRIYEDLVFRRRATECDIFSLASIPSYIIIRYYLDLGVFLISS